MDTETVTGPQQLVTRLYALLVRLYPYDFRTEFVEEMRAVFADALAEADEKGTLSLIAIQRLDFLGHRPGWHCALPAAGPGPGPG